MKLFERQHLKPVFHALQAQIKPVAEVVRNHGIEAGYKAVDVFHINQHLAPVITEIYKGVGLYFANKTIHDINQSVKQAEVKATDEFLGWLTFDDKGVPIETKAGFGFNPEFLQAILDFFNKYLLNKVVLPISETTRLQILDVLNQAAKNGWGAEKTARFLESPEFALWRARLIVRTESNKAMNYGQQLGESKSVWESQKRWIDAKDSRERASHLAVGGTQIDFNERWHVPIYRSVKGIQIQEGIDLMSGPGDPHASAGNVCNCRCTIAFAAKRDENGRLIRKASSPVLVDSE